MKMEAERTSEMMVSTYKTMHHIPADDNPIIYFCKSLRVAQYWSYEYTRASYFTVDGIMWHCLAPLFQVAKTSTFQSQDKQLLVAQLVK